MYIGLLIFEASGTPKGGLGLGQGGVSAKLGNPKPSYQEVSLNNKSSGGQKGPLRNMRARENKTKGS